MGGLARVKKAVMFLLFQIVGRLRLKFVPTAARVYFTTVTTAETRSPITLDRTTQTHLKLSSSIGTASSVASREALWDPSAT